MDSGNDQMISITTVILFYYFGHNEFRLKQIVVEDPDENMVSQVIVLSWLDIVGHSSRLRRSRAFVEILKIIIKYMNVFCDAFY